MHTKKIANAKKVQKKAILSRLPELEPTPRNPKLHTSYIRTKQNILV